MQHTRLPNFPPLFSSFKNHRSSIDQSRFRVNLTLPKPVAVPVWASLPTPPMSGSPPPEPPVEPPQIAGRRRKRSETPPPATAASIAGTAATPPTPLEQTAQGTAAQGRGGQGNGSSQMGLYASVYPPPPPMSYGSSSSMGVASASAGETAYAAGEISPKATRKTKAHVASACINCKKKHLRCDNTRPCRRCVQSNKEETCVDVEHKKRGRPPLKPDDASSRRPFESALSPLTGHPSDPSSRMSATDSSNYPPAPGYPRTFRPLQALPPYDPSRSQVRPGQPYQMYAQPTISPSPTMAMGTFISSARPYSSGQPLPTTQPPSPYMPGAADASRAMAPYSGGYSYPPPQGHMGPPPPQSYSNPIFPRTTLPPPAQGEPLMGMVGSSSLQLPPIRPAPQGNPVDPAIARQQQQSPREGQASGAGTTRQPTAKRPKMDIQGILGPRSD